jgi:glycosyltransferase involved in cell wall biosynthesis
MKIGIDARLWSQTGVGRYIRNLVINLHKNDRKNNYILFVRNDDKKNVEEEITSSNWKIVASSVRWHSLRDQINFPRIIKKENVDLMHFPYFDTPFFYKQPYVITIHDLVYHHFMTGKASTNAIWLYGLKMLAYKIIINSAARKARKIISVSDSTREEIFEHLLVNKNKVEVIYEAVDDFNSQTESKNNYGKYFLFVGNVYPHKNTDNLVKAFKILIEKEKVKLIFAGNDDYFYTMLKKQTSKLIKEGHIIIKENINDSELSGLYKNAVALVRPSFMEGFSLPPLEAMRMECLVLASDIPVHKEILKDIPFYFNPKDQIDLNNKMNYVLNLDEKERSEKISSGKKLAETFSWEKAAKETLKVYLSC